MIMHPARGAQAISHQKVTKMRWESEAGAPIGCATGERDSPWERYTPVGLASTSMRSIDLTGSSRTSPPLSNRSFTSVPAGPSFQSRR